MSLGVPPIQQEISRQGSLVTPITFSADIGASSTTVYAAPTNRDEALLLRRILVVNDTAGAVDLEIQVGGRVWVPTISVAASTAIEEPGLAGMLLDVGEDMTATGNGLALVGWGLRVQGGDRWTL